MWPWDIHGFGAVQPQIRPAPGKPMTKAVCLALLVVAASFHRPSSLEECWKGSTTNGSNPGLNTMTLCVAANDDIELEVYFPNTPIREPPTTCMSPGRRLDSRRDTFRAVTEVGQCENGSTMGQYDLRCTVVEENTMSCTFPVPSGDLVSVKLEKDCHDRRA